MRNTGTRYEIIVDGVTRTHRDERKFALEAAALLREKAPGRRVVVKDTATQEIINPPGARDADAPLCGSEDSITARVRPPARP
jgi:hypothetical protein